MDDCFTQGRTVSRTSSATSSRPNSPGRERRDEAAAFVSCFTAHAQPPSQPFHPAQPPSQPLHPVAPWGVCDYVGFRGGGLSSAQPSGSARRSAIMVLSRWALAGGQTRVHGLCDGAQSVGCDAGVMRCLILVSRRTSMRMKDELV